MIELTTSTRAVDVRPYWGHPQVADYIGGVSTDTVRNLVLAGYLDGLRLPGVKRNVVTAESLDRYLARARETAELTRMVSQ
ncbi:hypothetical protein [Euzebya sp.]|uniref:hypothetical protein n=1 Tax=Euzebya sp. TaxID=1971409 RepID=UPI003519BE07